ncbi:MAG TPA: endonuclease III [Verrucomicrobiae bacterium]|nr:endonuclease III [Verrucomicrobiae bacterium]
MSVAKRKLRDRCRTVLRRLRAAYPDAQCALHHQNPLQLLVATILSAQCTDERVNRVTPALFRKYRSAAAFANAPPGELEAMIRSTGFFRSKARAIRNCCRGIVDKHRGQVPETLDELVQLDGVGRKTANVVLGVAYGKAEGIVVDTHVSRLSQRLGLTRQTMPEKIEADLMPIVPRQDWIDFAHLLIWHGRKRCTARKPECIQCEVAELCPRIGVK